MLLRQDSKVVESECMAAARVAILHVKMYYNNVYTSCVKNRTTIHITYVCVCIQTTYKQKARSYMYIHVNTKIYMYMGI